MAESNSKLLAEWQAIYKQLREAQELMRLALEMHDKELIAVCWRRVNALQDESDRLISAISQRAEETAIAPAPAPRQWSQ